MYIIACICIFILITFVLIVAFVGSTKMLGLSVIFGAVLGFCITFLLAYYNII